MADVTRVGVGIRCKSAKLYIKEKTLRQEEDKTEKSDFTLFADENNNNKTNKSIFSLDLSKPDFIFTESDSNNSTLSYSLTKQKIFKKHAKLSPTVSHPSNSGTFVKLPRSKSSMKVLNRKFSLDQKDLTLKRPKSSLNLNEVSCTLKVAAQVDSSSTTLTDLPILKKLCAEEKFYPEKSVTICGKIYKIGHEIGRGGSSRVYEAKYKKQIFAIKVVDFDDVSDTVIEGYMEEVKLLEDLQDEETIIQMEAYELKENEEGEKQLFVVMEKGENDFQTFLRSTDRSSNLIRYYWESMLNCVKTVHAKNIVHADLKPANFIFVKNKLKLIDFGIASTIPTDLTSIAKESQAGTLNYMSPESIQLRSDDNKVHVPLASDIWSLGCILYLMVYGTPPFGHVTSQMAKINAILYKDIEFKEIEDQNLLNVMQQCLQRDYQKRPTVIHLLEHSYLRPSTSNPSSTNESVITKLVSSMNEATIEEDSIMVGKIVQEVCKNTPRTAAKNVYKMLKAHKISTN